MLGEMAKGKKFLNLFCYTAAATVQAALGGAKRTLSIDMSNTYLDWAGRNFELNQLECQQPSVSACRLSELVGRTDNDYYDVILLDPPTFSNSKKMDSVLDVQRDHGELIRNHGQARPKWRADFLQ